MRRDEIWRTLGIEPTADRNLVRSAYARRLRVTNPEDDAEAFQHLRAAYEAALSLAESSMAVALVDDDEEDEPYDDEYDGDADDDRATPLFEATPVAGLPADQAEFRERFQRLSQLLSTADTGEAELEAAFSDLCASAALDDVFLRVQFESQLATLLLQKTPQSHALLGRAAVLMRWHAQATRVGVHGAIIAAAKYADDLDYLARLAEPGHELHRAWRALTRVPKPVLLRAGIVLFMLDRKVDRLLAEFRHRYLGRIAALNPAAVAWWNLYRSRPRASPMLLRVAIALPLLTVLVKLPDSAINNAVATARMMIAMALLIVAKLYVLDVPRQWIRTHWHSRRHTGWGQRLGWFALGAAVAILAAVVHAPGATMALAMTAAICALWAWQVAPETAAMTPWGRIYNNIPVVIWLMVLASFLPPAMVFVFCMLVLAEMLGEDNLLGFWLTSVPARMRLACLVLLLLAACGGLAAVFALASDRAAYPLIAALTLVLVLLQRAPALQLDKSGHVARHYAMIFCGLGGLTVGWLDNDRAAVIWFSGVFLFGIAFGMTALLLKQARQLWRATA